MKRWFPVLLLVLASPLWGLGGEGFDAVLAEMRPGPGVTRIGALSEYLPSLAGTPVDTPVYFLESGGGAGATVLILGGTHGDEIAGVLAASLFIEHALPARGRLIVIPRANASAAGWPDPDRPGPALVRIGGAAGEREIRYGSRYTNPLHEIIDDPPRYLPEGAAEGAALAGRESRNLNRNYPGKDTGSLTARTAFAVMELMRKEKVDIAFDLHEAGPVSGLAWDIIAHPKNIDYAAMGILGMEEKGVKMVLDVSREEHRGLSHREWGERTGARAYLVETLNPGQVTGGRPGFDHLDNDTSPLWKRAGTHVEVVLAILAVHAEFDEPAGGMEIGGMPSFYELARNFSAYF